MKPFTKGEFVKEYLSTEDKRNSILEQKQVFANGRLNRNAVAWQDDDTPENLQDGLCEKVQSFVAFPREAYRSPVKIIPPSQKYLFMVPKRLGHDWKIWGAWCPSQPQLQEMTWLGVLRKLEKFKAGRSTLVSLAMKQSS